MTLKTVTFKIDEETLIKLDTLAAETGINRSEHIRKAISLYLFKVENELKNRPRIRVIKYE
jgi:metal-responsive CopG/Arc/MetJ family transcriptional regulator